MVRILVSLFFCFGISNSFALLNEKDSKWSSSMWNPQNKISGEDFIKRNEKLHLEFNRDSAQALAQTLNKVDFNQMETFSDLNELKEIFSLFLSTLIADDSMHSGIKRRIPWLYIEDGCYARAAFAVDILKNMPQYRDKLKTFFVFGGKLRGTRQYVPHDSQENRYVTGWSYHVVLAAKLGKQVYILDPSANFRKLLTLKEWMDETVLTPDESKFSLCSVFTTNPRIPCQSSESEFYDYLDQNRHMLGPFLAKEYEIFLDARLISSHTDEAYKKYLLGEEHAYWKWPVLIPPNRDEFKYHPVPVAEGTNGYRKKFVVPGAKWIKVCWKLIWQRRDSDPANTVIRPPYASAQPAEIDYWGWQSKASTARITIPPDSRETKIEFCSTAQPGDTILAFTELLERLPGGMTHFLVAN